MEMLKQEFKGLIKTRNTHPVIIHDFVPDQDTYFVKKILVPYLSSVFMGLI